MSYQMKKFFFTFIFIVTMTCFIAAQAGGIPGNPSLSHNNWSNLDNYTITMNMWWGNNGTSWSLYENDQLVITQQLVDNSPNAQTASYVFTGKPNGTYQYYCVLTNSYGSKTSNLITVTVTQGTSTPTPTPPVGVEKKMNMEQEKKALNVIINSSNMGALARKHNIDYIDPCFWGYVHLGYALSKSTAGSDDHYVQFEFVEDNPISKVRVGLSEKHSLLIETAATAQDLADKTGTYQIFLNQSTVTTTRWVEKSADPVSDNKFWKLTYTSTSDINDIYVNGIEFYTYDNGVPTTPTQLQAVGLDARTIELSWQPSTDDKYVSGYKVYRNGSYIGSTITNKYTDTLLTPQTNYTYTVKAYDAVDNESGMSNSAAAVTTNSMLVKTTYNVLVLNYSPTIKAGTYNYYDPILNKHGTKTVAADTKFKTLYNLTYDAQQDARDKALKYEEASGGTIKFNVIIEEVDSHPYPNDLEVMNSQTLVEYMELVRPNNDFYYVFDIGGFNYHRAFRQNNVLERVENGEVDIVWIASDVDGIGGGPGSGPWEAAMGGNNAYWINGSPITVYSSKRFAVVAGGGYECVGHMIEQIMATKTREFNWPEIANFNFVTAVDPNNPGKNLETHGVNEWFRFCMTENTNYGNSPGPVSYISPGNAAVGDMHFPPNSPYNYGAGYLINDGRFMAMSGDWSRTNNVLTSQTGPRSINVAWDDNAASEVDEHAMVFKSFDCTADVKLDTNQANADAGLLFRAQTYVQTPDILTGYYAAINAYSDRVTLGKYTNGVYAEFASVPYTIDTNVYYTLNLEAMGAVIKLSINGSTTPVITYTIPDYNEFTLDNTGALGYMAQNTGATFNNFFCDPYALTNAANWRNYPDISGPSQYVSSKVWNGNLATFQLWLFSYIPRNPGMHNSTDVNTGAVFNGMLNNWWHYIYDINRFDGSPITYEVTGYPVPVN